MAWVAAGIAAASAIGGAASARKSSNFQRRAMEQQQFSIDWMKYDLKEGRRLSEENFALSLGELNKVGPAMRAELLARGKEDIAAQQASALGTGLTGTSAMSGQLRGARADTQRTLSQLEGSLAGARSELYARRGSEVYQQYVDKANVDQRTVYDPFLSGWSGQIGSGADYSGLGTALDDIFSWFGGSGGGGTGSDDSSKET